VSLLRKLARLDASGLQPVAPASHRSAPAPTVANRAPDTEAAAVAAASMPPNPAREVVLAELRERMSAVAARHAIALPRTPPPVETDELPFTTRETSLGPLHLRSQQLSAAHRIGNAPLLAARSASPTWLSNLALDPAVLACEPRGALYLDTETTGLSGGPRTVA
jgi:hypothetical protein